jgi:hypothetical protein
LLRKLPPKLKDPGSFTIPCRIGNQPFDRALLDLGASINLLPYTVYETLGLGELQPTSITLQLADRSIKRPRGILEDVLVQVKEFILPADFIVLDMEETPMQSALPIILGRPFMRTADTKICVKKGTVSMRVNDEKIEFKVFDALKLPQDDNDCFNVCVVQSIVEEIFQVHSFDPFEAVITHSLEGKDMELICEDDNNNIIDAVQALEDYSLYPGKHPPPLKLWYLLTLLLFLLLSGHQSWS